MKTKRQIRLTYPVLLVVVPLLLALLPALPVVMATNASQALAAVVDTKPPAAAVQTLERTAEAFAQVAAAVKPAVVNISTSKSFKASDQRHSMEPFFNDPFFRHFFGDPREFAPRRHKERSLGSGVLIASDGVIVTNNHVVDEADEIVVKLSDGREFTGTVVGKDPKTDIAVIRIEATDLPFLAIGDSTALEVGHLVMAVGNPFGLNQTVTTGIVSAKGRANVGIADYEDFIQTDAAINPGNSGGAMVNVRGELVGINTAIFSTTGGYQGIGFAVPTSIVKPVVDSLLDRGKVVRGWLGVMIQNVTPALAEQFGLDEAKGALVSDVVKGSPAEKAGMARGDVIVAFQGKSVEDTGHLRNQVAATAPETTALFAVLRSGKRIEVKVVLGELPSDLVAPGGSTDTTDVDNAFAGVSVDEISPVIHDRLDLPDDLTGVVVTAIRDGSPAERVLRPGDVIIEINRTSIENVNDYREAVRKIGDSDTALVLVYRKGSTLFFTISKNS